MENALVFLHLEAASETWPTFPAEVYVSSGDGGSAGWLVNSASIARWQGWPTPFFERHDLTPVFVQGYGTAPDRVCRELEERIGGRTVCSLAPEVHRALLSELFQAALGTECLINVVDAKAALAALCSTGGDSLVEKAFEEVGETRPIRGGAFEIPFLHAVEALCRLAQK